MRFLFLTAALFGAASFAQAQVDTAALLKLTRPQGVDITAQALGSIQQGDLVSAGRALASIDPNDSLFIENCVYAAQFLADTSIGEAEIEGILLKLRRYYPQERSTYHTIRALYHLAGGRKDSVLQYTSAVVGKSPSTTLLADIRTSQLFRNKDYARLYEEAKIIVPYQPGNYDVIKRLALSAHAESKYAQCYAWCLFGLANASDASGANNFLSLIESFMLETAVPFTGKATLPSISALDDLDDILQSGAATKESYRYTGPYADLRAMKQIHLFFSAVKGKTFSGTSAVETIVMPYLQEIERQQKWPNVLGGAAYLISDGKAGKETDLKKWVEARPAALNTVPALHYVQYRGKEHTVDSRYSGGSLQAANLIEGKYDPKNWKNIHVIELDPTGYKKTEFDMMPPESVVGTSYVFYPDEAMKAEMTFKSSKPDGPAKTYEPNGKLTKSVVYKDGAEDGTELYYYPSGALRRKESKSVAGKTTGYENTYYADGSLSDSVLVVNEEADGAQWTYFNTGALNSKAFSKKGQAEGLSTSFYANGNKKSERTYQAGKLYGKAYNYHENGRVQQVTTYAGDRMIDTLYLYNTRGQLTEKDLILNDYANRKELYYDNGRHFATIEYVADKVTATSHIDPTGKAVRQEKFNKGKATRRTYWPDGAVAEEMSLKDGEMDGAFTSYFRFGGKRQETVYKNGNKQGREVLYYPNGTLYQEFNYLDGSQQGLQLVYYASGAVKQAYYSESGSVQGYLIEFDGKGRVTRRNYYKNDNVVGWTHRLDSAGAIREEDHTIDGIDLCNREYYTPTFYSEVDGVLSNGKIDVKDDKGRLEKSLEYRFGCPVGKQVHYHTATGKPSFEYNSRNGTLYGPYKAYEETGSLLSDYTYTKDGNLTGDGPG